MQLPGYSIGGVIGDGGMATVYRAEQLSLQRPVAIKVLKPGLLDHAEVRERFSRESRIIARLNHPNIIAVIDQGLTTEGHPYFVMEWVKSIPLGSAMGSVAMTPVRALDVFSQIARGLSYAHKNGVVHCDIKPDNILVDFEGQVRILDFGIAHLLDGSESDTELVMGSRAYMAPEQRRGLAHACAQSDLYALGVIMHQYFLRCAEGALGGEQQAEVATLIRQCLMEVPTQRPASAEEVRHRLLRVLQGSHLGQQQRQRAAADLKKDFRLLDVIKENQHSAVYLFDARETQRPSRDTHQAYIVKKQAADAPGFALAQRMAKLPHPHIARVYGASRNNRVFILVSEYCRGGALAERLLRPMTLVDFLPVGRGMVAALCFAHAQGIVHGNLRPSNVLFDIHNTVKLCDFGLDEHYAGHAERNWYQPTGEPASERGDIFALGVMFYQMLTGELPQWRRHTLLRRRRFQRLPEALRACIADMLMLDSQRRLATVAQVRSVLDNLADSEFTEVRVRDTLTDRHLLPWSWRPLQALWRRIWF